MNSLKNIIAPSAMRTVDPAKLEVHELLAARFKLCDSVMREYIDYAQMVENKSHKQVLAEVTAIADDLVAKYSLGSSFIDGLQKYMMERYHRSANESFEAIQKGSSLEPAVFEYVIAAFRKDGVAEKFSPRFRTVFS